jgi:protein-disulfide isomerase
MRSHNCFSLLKLSSLTLLTVFSVNAQSQQANPTRDPLTFPEIEELVALRVPEPVLVGSVRNFGVKFPLSEKESVRLSELGAPLSLLQAIKIAAAPTALSPAALVPLIRYVHVWRDEVQVRVNLKPSLFKGVLQAEVNASLGQASHQTFWYVASDGSSILVPGLAEFNKGENPFASDLALISTIEAPAFGPMDAPVHLVVYSDFQCSFCAQHARMLRQNIPASYAKDVRVYFKDFPIAAIHPWATEAAAIGRCINALDTNTFWEFHDWIFQNQGSIQADNLRTKALEFAGRSVDALKLAGCVENRQEELAVKRSLAEAPLLRLNASPTTFVNGRRLVGSLDWTALKQVIDFELQYGAQFPRKR